MNKFNLYALLFLPLVTVSNVSAAPFEPYDEMLDLGPLHNDNRGSNWASAVSADGSTVVGQADTEDSNSRAFRWNSALGAMQDLGTLRNDNRGWSGASAVSADGSTVVGLADTEDGPIRAFRWNSALGAMQDLGTLRNDNRGWSGASAVSADGSTVVGGADTEDGNSRAFRWNSALGAMQDLGTLRNDNRGWSGASAVSADGSTVVGIADTEDNSRRAFRWTEALNAMQDLGSLRNDNLGSSSASAVSADGSTVVGGADTEDGNSRAFRWNSALGAMQDLGSLRNDNRGWSSASAVSADGSTVVGSADTEDNSRRAFRWTEALNAMQDLGSLRNDNLGYTWAAAVSADGSTVVGTANTEDSNSRAFRWNSALGAMQDLGTLRNDNRGWSGASAVSADGSTVVGYAETEDGNTRAFIYRVWSPFESGIMQDHINVLQSFSSLASETEQAAAQQQLAMNRLLGNGCFVGAAGMNCLRVSGVVSNTGSDNGMGRTHQTQGLLTLGHGLSENATLGVSLSSGSTRLRDSGISADTAFGLGLLGEYSEGGLARTGLQVSVGVGVNTQDNELTRGKSLSNVQQLKGSADMSTVAARVGLGYGVMHKSGWLITPGMALVQQRTTRDGYSENRGAITGDYKKARLNATVVDLGLDAQTSIDSASRVKLGMGVEHDLHVDRMSLNGTTDVPGMESLNYKSNLVRNDIRAYMTANYSYDLSVGGTLSTGLRVAQDAFSDAGQAAISVGYEVKI
ncbi:autotransporter domain-containing protein [Pseudomonas sp. Fl4BN1]|uniref:autotransporter domain-containing protein n=1 Tax=Pseudomonas sp. Fl4BN1 TaxID=2697651 RepID=UPI0013787545|nr:autotransporter domain-containing protein [Pseudomonas sp. Fl4BN1]NBF11410.1 autotransporter domain-containing protein [Pseudomonas sp. Fl4BN1]